MSTNRASFGVRIHRKPFDFWAAKWCCLRLSSTPNNCHLNVERMFRSFPKSLGYSQSSSMVTWGSLMDIHAGWTGHSSKAQRTGRFIINPRWKHLIYIYILAINYQKIMILVGGIPTPVKNDGVRQLGWWHSQLNGKSFKIPWFQSPPTRFYYWHLCFILGHLLILDMSSYVIICHHMSSSQR